jgi:uncharacterized protein (DUF2062 family)
MLFRSRVRPGVLKRLRLAAWPRHSWSRSARYFTKRILRLSGSPHAIAAGVAAGTFASFTPFIGFHFLIGFVIAFLLGGNMVAAALGTAVGNPLTFPFIWASTYKVGSIILGADATATAMASGQLSPELFARSLDAIAPIVGPMVVGSVPLGVPASVALYILVFQSVRGFRALRQQRIAARQRARNAGSRDATTDETEMA